MTPAIAIMWILALGALYFSAIGLCAILTNDTVRHTARLTRRYTP